MSEMVERVALAISGGDVPASILEIHRHRARAAIEAMREPTKKMVQEALCSANFPIGTWEAMIDEALK